MHKQVPSVNKTKQCANCNTTCEMCTVPTEEVEVLEKIKTITARGNDAEVRRKKDGKYAVYTAERVRHN